MPTTFPADIWNKLLLTEYDIQYYIGNGCGKDIFDDDYDWRQGDNLPYERFIVTDDEIQKLKLSVTESFTYMEIEYEQMYFGQTKNGLKNGFGAILCKISDGIKIQFSGNWSDGKKSRFGIKINEFHNHPSYMGEWKDDNFNGEGIWFSIFAAHHDEVQIDRIVVLDMTDGQEMGRINKLISEYRVSG